MIEPQQSKPPTLDTRPDDLAHGPEVPHHRFSVFHETGDYAYARGLEVNPTHLPIALDAMRKSGWHLVSIFGATDSKHVGFVFRREGLSSRLLLDEAVKLRNENARLRRRVDELFKANEDLVNQRRAASKQSQGLQRHLRAMQAMMCQYLEPSVDYIAQNGERYIEQDAGFISDMIYMLDGPEQRAVLPNDDPTN